MVRFLLSEEASDITASEYVVDGGNISSQRTSFTRIAAKLPRTIAIAIPCE